MAENKRIFFLPRRSGNAVHATWRWLSNKNYATARLSPQFAQTANRSRVPPTSMAIPIIFYRYLHCQYKTTKVKKNTRKTARPKYTVQDIPRAYLCTVISERGLLDKIRVRVRENVEFFQLFISYCPAEENPKS